MSSRAKTKETNGKLNFMNITNNEFHEIGVIFKIQTKFRSLFHFKGWISIYILLRL